MRRVLITGSAGFVGAHLVEHLLFNTDWEIIGLDSFKHRGDSMRIYQDASRYKIFTHDLTTPISDRLIDKIGDIDFIINVASESHVDRSITDPVPFINNNVGLIVNVLEYARKVKPMVFIQISTDEVYGAALNNHNHREWEPILPSNPYSASKASQEAIAISYWRTFGVPLIITNTMNMFGERQDREKFIPMVIKKVLNKEVVTIHGNDKFIGTRYYLHARNHADALLFLLDRKKVTHYQDSMHEIIKPDRYNIVGDIEVNNLDMALKIAECMGEELRYELVDFHSARPGHDRRYALDGDKIKKLGWKAPIDFYNSLSRTVQWTLNHPEWLL
jgi:dTDP-glucose 4,6-dehydratase